MALIELRDYHYRPDRLDIYRDWATEAGSFLRDRWEVSGFWVDSGEPARISGADPMELPHGPANVSWMIRWNDLDEREAAWEALWEDDDWNAIWARHPGFDDYLQLSVRFLEEV
jgi:hypothetical protein